MKRKEAAAKYHLAIMLCFIWMVLLASCGKKQAEQIKFDNLQVVQVNCENQRGSGVVCAAPEGAAVVITASHVLDGNEKVTVLWQAEKKENDVETDTISKVNGLDLAFLEIEGTSVLKEPLYEPDKNHGDQVILRGYNATGEIQESAGIVSHSWIYVEDFGCHMMIVKAETVPGMSGGGVFYTNGEFAGIICGEDEEGNVAILPASVILAEYSVKFGK